MPPTDETAPPLRAPRPGEADASAAAAAPDMEDFDVEAALLAMSEDMGGPTTDVDLSALSPTERQALLRYLRERLGIAAMPV